MTNSLVIFVENRFKNILEEDKLALYLKMAKFIEANEDKGSLCWDANDALNNYILQNGNLGLEDPTKSEWKEFLADSGISDILEQKVIATRKPALRKIIASIDEDKSLTQSEMKALGALKDLIAAGDSYENNMKYIQYYTEPVAYDDNVDNQKVIERYLVKNGQE